MTSSLNNRLSIYSTNMDLLRFIAAVCVIISHSYTIVANIGDPLQTLRGGRHCTSLGGFAVAVLFFISGLYVTRSLEHSDSIRAFFKKRCLRIFPPMVVLVLVTIFILGPVLTTLPLSIYFTSKQTYLYLLNIILIPVHNLPGVFENNPYLPTVNGALWTMPYEFACYLALIILACFSKKTKKKRREYDLLAFFLLLVSYIFLAYVSKNQGLVTRIRPILFFFEGVIAYDLRRKIKLNPIIGMVLMILLIVLAFTSLFDIAMIICFPYFILSETLGLPQLKKRCRLFSAEYEMYLVGFPIQQTTIYLAGSMSPLANWLIAVPVDIVVGFLFHILMLHIEKH